MMQPALPLPIAISFCQDGSIHGQYDNSHIIICRLTSLGSLLVQVLVRNKRDADIYFDRAMLYIELGEVRKVGVRLPSACLYV